MILLFSGTVEPTKSSRCNEIAMGHIRIRQEKDKVLLLCSGRPAIELPWEAAVELSKALRQKAAIAREQDKHELIIADQSILLAVGAPIRISATGKMLRTALKEAEYHGGTKNGINNALKNDTHPRQRALKGIKSRTIVGHTTLFNVPDTQTHKIIPRPKHRT